MISSFAVSITLLVLSRNGVHFSTHAALLMTVAVAVTTVCWVLTAYVAPGTDRATLVSFYKKVRPFGPGWTRVRIEAGVSEADSHATRENSPLALLGWVTGCTMIWLALFTVGNFLYGRTGYALGLLAVFVVSGLVLLKVVNRVWSDRTAYRRGTHESAPRGAGAASRGRTTPIPLTLARRDRAIPWGEASAKAP